MRAQYVHSQQEVVGFPPPVLAVSSIAHCKLSKTGGGEGLVGEGIGSGYNMCKAVRLWCVFPC